MNAAETTRLLAIAASIWPAMRLEEHTAEAWALVLADVPYGDAAEALKVLATSSTFPPAVADVMREVRKTWDRRESLAGALPVPNVDPEDRHAYAAELGALRKAIRRGTLTAERREQYALGGWTLSGVPARPALERGTRKVDPGHVRDLADSLAVERGA